MVVETEDHANARGANIINVALAFGKY